MSNAEINNITTSQSKPKWKRCLRKCKFFAAKTIQAIVPINCRVRKIDKEEIKRLERCQVGYELIEKRKGIHPIVQVLEPECEQNSAVTHASDFIGLASEDIKRSEIETSVQLTPEERDKSAETDLQEIGFGILKSNSGSEFKDLELKENLKSGLIVFDFSKAHRDWKLISERADTEEISSLSEQCLLPTGADQIGDEGIQLRRTPDFEPLNINFSIMYSDWLLVSECVGHPGQRRDHNCY